MANKLQTADETDTKPPRYTVSFEWRDHYSKGTGINSVSMTIEADTNFAALMAAWELLKPLNLPEPKTFNATRRSGCE